MTGKANNGPAERLTGKQRVLRGLKYFAGTFAAVFALCALLVALPPEGDWGWGIVAGLVRGLPTAVLAGGMVVLFPVRRLWHGVCAVVAAVLAAGWMM